MISKSLSEFIQIYRIVYYLYLKEKSTTINNFFASLSLIFKFKRKNYIDCQYTKGNI